MAPVSATLTQGTMRVSAQMLEMMRADERAFRRKIAERMLPCKATHHVNGIHFLGWGQRA